MTVRKISISLPGDIAAGMEHVPAGEVSAYVADALRRKQAGDTVRAVLSAAGFPAFPVDPEAAAARAAAAQVPADVRARALERLAAVTGQPAEALDEQITATAVAAGW